MSYKSIRYRPENERPRERLMQYGADRLVQAGDIVGIRVLDHIIIGENTYTGMMEKGYIKNKQ